MLQVSHAKALLWLRTLLPENSFSIYNRNENSCYSSTFLSLTMTGNNLQPRMQKTIYKSLNKTVYTVSHSFAKLNVFHMFFSYIMIREFLTALLTNVNNDRVVSTFYTHPVVTRVQKCVDTQVGQSHVCSDHMKRTFA